MNSNDKNDSTLQKDALNILNQHIDISKYLISENSLKIRQINAHRKESQKLREINKGLD